MKARGFSLIELLITLSIIVVLMTAIGAAIVGVLHLQAMHAGRAEMSRSASDLATRLSEEARSSTAVFIPKSDVLGNPNGTSAAHEVDFLRRLSDGGDAYVAYRFDPGTTSVIRYDYSVAASVKTVLYSDTAATGIASFTLNREPVASSGAIVGQPDPAEVTIYYGTTELAGGNDIVVANILTSPASGLPSHLYAVHLASRAAPTSLAILAPKGAPPSPTPTKTFPFVILRPGFPITPPHGPIHGGSPGGPASFIHWVSAQGSIDFIYAGRGSGVSWFDFTSAFTRISSGTYTFRQPDGSSVIATVACIGGLCPEFKPLPVSAPAFTPKGGVAFELSPSP